MPTKGKPVTLGSAGYGPAMMLAIVVVVGAIALIAGLIIQ